MRTKLMIIAETCKDGVGKHVSDLLRYVDKSEFEVVMVQGTKRVDYYFDAVKEQLIGEIIFEEVPSMNRNIHPIDDMRALIHINRLIMKYRPTLIHCHSSKAGVLGRWLGIHKKYVKKIFYTPHAYAIQNLNLNSYRHMLFLELERWLGHHNKVHTCNVSFGENEFARRYNIIGNASVVYNAIEDKPLLDTKESVHDLLGIDNDILIVICVARLFKQKNPQLFLDIAEEVLKQRKDLVFMWVGEGEMLPSMQRKVQISDVLNGKVHFVGMRKDVHSLLCGSDIFLSTSLYEGLPYTLIEACRAGLPLVGTDITGNNELIIDGVNGQLIAHHQVGNHTDTNAIVDGSRVLIDLASNQDMRKCLGNRGREIFINRFGIEHMIHEIEKLYVEGCR